VWDVEHILEIVHPIEKMELKITKVRKIFKIAAYKNIITEKNLQYMK
jgi:hypothetical protein